MRLNEVRAELAHVDVIVDVHIAAHGMLREPGGCLAVPPGGRDDDIGSAARHDLVQHLNARRVQTPVPIPPVDGGEHPVDVEKDHPSHYRNAPRWEKRVSWLVMNSSSAACPLSVASRARAKAPAMSSGRSTRSLQPPMARPRSA